jgi:hypothetical protein
MELEEVVRTLLGRDQGSREIAETALHRFISKQAENTVKGLLAFSKGKEVELALMSLHVLRTHIIECVHWRAIPEATRRSAHSHFLTTILTSSHIQVKRLAVAGLVSALEAEGRGEDLVTVVEQWTQDSAHCQSALWLLCEALTCIKDLAWIPVLWTRLILPLKTLMQAADPSICLSALRTTSMLLTALPSPIDPRVKDTAKSLFSALTLYLKISPGQEETLSPVLTQFITMTEKHPNVWDSCSELQRVLITLAESRYFADAIRREAVELLRVWVQGCKPKEGENEAMIKLAFCLMDEKTEGVGAGEESISDLGSFLLSNICAKYSDFPSFQTLKQAIETHFHASEWPLQVTGLIAITQSLSSMHSHYESHLSSLIPALTSILSSASLRVRKAIFTTIAAICREFEPLVQRQFHGLIIPIIGTGLGTDERYEAAEALICFMKGLIGETNVDYMVAYAPDLMRSLEQALLSQANRENAYPVLIEAVGATAAALQTHFSPYRLPFLSRLQPLLLQSSPSLQLQCLTVLSQIIRNGEAEEAVRAIAEEILKNALTLAENMQGSEEFEEGLEGCFGSFAVALRERFVPYLKSIVGKMLEKVRFEEYMCSNEYLNTYADQRRNAALKALYALICAVGSLYSPLVQSTLSTLIPYCALSPNLILSKYSLKTISKSLALYLPSQSREGLLRIILPELLTALKSAYNCPKYTIWVLKAFAKSLESVELPGSIGLPLASECSATLAETLSQAIRLRASDVHYRTIITSIGPVVVQLLRGFKRQYYSCFKQYFLTFYDYMLKKPHNSLETAEIARVLSAYVKYTDDFLIVNSRSLIIEKFFACLEVTEANKEALKGLKLCAERCPKGVFAGYAQKCRYICTELLDEVEDVSYLAMAALGSILISHFPEEIEDWLHLLPLDSACVEAQSVHSLFLHAKSLFFRLEAETERVMQELRANPALVSTEDRQLLLT